MFDKSKQGRLRKTEIPLPGDSRIRLLHFQKRCFIAGLQWETIRTTRHLMKEVRRIGKERHLDVVAIRKSDAIQVGFAPKTKEKLRGGYSLIVALASLLPGYCIAVIPLGINEKGEDEYTLLGKTERGGIHPFSDEIYYKENLYQTVIDLRSELRGNKTELDIPVYGDKDLFDWITETLDLDRLLAPQNLTKDFKLKPLTWGMTKNQLVVLSITGMVLIIVIFLIFSYLDYQATLQQKIKIREKEKLEKINREARYHAVLKNFKHPWIETPAISDFIASCSGLLKQIPMSIAGWNPTNVICNASGMTVNLARPDNSAVTTQ